MWLGCRQQEATEADLILSRFKAPPLILHKFLENHKKKFSDISTFSFPVCSSASWQFCVALASTAAKNQVKAKSYLDFETDAFKLLLIKNHFFPILLANFSKLLFSRLGLLPVLVLLLYNAHYHRFWGLCGSSTGAQLDKKSRLCCHQVCS